MANDDKSQSELIADVARVAEAMRLAPTLGTADPRYWVVQTQVWHRNPRGDGDIMIHVGDDAQGRAVGGFMRDLLARALADESLDPDGTTVLNLAGGTFRALPGTDPTETSGWQFVGCDPHELEDAVEHGRVPYHDGDEISVEWGEWRYEDVPNTMFLTLDEAQRHIDENAHHYRRPRTYGRRAWRSPDAKALWHALKCVDWDLVADALEAYDAGREDR